MNTKGSKGMMIVVLISLVLALSLTAVSAADAVGIQQVSDLSTHISPIVCRVTITVTEQGTSNRISNATVVWDNSVTTYTDANGQTTCDVSPGWHTANISKFIPEENECYQNNSCEFRCYSCGNPLYRTVYLTRCCCPTPTPVPTPTPIPTPTPTPNPAAIPVPVLSPIGIIALVSFLGLCGLIAIKKKK